MNTISICFTKNGRCFWEFEGTTKKELLKEKEVESVVEVEVEDVVIEFMSKAFSALMELDGRSGRSVCNHDEHEGPEKKRLCQLFSDVEKSDKGLPADTVDVLLDTIPTIVAQACLQKGRRA